jgi:hypothetical protein
VCLRAAAGSGVEEGGRREGRAACARRAGGARLRCAVRICFTYAGRAPGGGAARARTRACAGFEAFACYVHKSCPSSLRFRPAKRESSALFARRLPKRTVRACARARARPAAG